jgi:hypothetical protein
MLKRSAIGELESLIATEIIPAKQEILRSAVVKEMGTMVEGSLQSVMAQLSATQGELAELSKLSGKNRELAKTMLGRLEKDARSICSTWKASKPLTASCSSRGTR